MFIATIAKGETEDERSAAANALGHLCMANAQNQEMVHTYCVWVCARAARAWCVCARAHVCSRTHGHPCARI